MNSLHSPIALPPWTQPGWLEEASAWILTELEGQGIRVSGPIEQPHVRPWSTVLRAPTRVGDVYFKAAAPALVHEPALIEALAHWRPDCMPQLLAVDVARGWMLMADGGTRLREVIRADRDIGHWEKLLPFYAGLQIELAGRLPELAALGVPDRRLAVLPALYEQLLADAEMVRPPIAEAVTAEEYQRLRDLSPQVVAWSQELAGYQVPESLNHGDFHDGNIFVRDGRYTFFDWGDSSLAHPFFTLRTTFVSIENSLGLLEGSPETERLLDAYLEPWTRYEPRRKLQAASQLARRLAPILSALGWHRALSSVEKSLRQPYLAAVPGLMQEFLAMGT
ncbi:MAG: aminoglycoside phosphotransferase family protein [Chloroflexi bacterium]|nr:aminoglycoside phosphotransferase family protein [Chloroflexota bacterium]MCI0577716.1 aminoglycoside phosphotransferase family protein [Chloroflexota bacterium]MCI0649799.1 aminoglycoside phosphotransferase family protein [Chloroflexota bacterium]MCI0730508.1 aminoglycoside phosphotransferase family protein [Chloroflexota bacterium]